MPVRSHFGTSLMWVVLYSMVPRTTCTIPVSSCGSLLSDLHVSIQTATMAPTHEKNANCKVRSAAAAASSRLPSEPAEDTPVYVISSNHGLTAHVSHWNGQALLQLGTRCQDRKGSQCSIMVTLDAVEVEVLAHDIARVENMLQEHNAQKRDDMVDLLLRQLPGEDTGRYRHLEVSCWQGHVHASVWRLFINNQSQLCPTRDNVQYNVDQLSELRCLLLLIHDDFAPAARTAQQMSEQEPDTMAVILAWEQKNLEGSQQTQEEEAADEVNSLPAALAPLPPPPQLAIVGGLREAGSPLHPHPQQRWQPRHQQTLRHPSYQS